MVQIAQDFQEAECGHAYAIHCGFGKLQADAGTGLAGQVVEFIRLGAADDPAQVRGVLKGAVVQEKLLAHDLRVGNQMADIATADRVRTVHKTMNCIVL